MDVESFGLGHQFADIDAIIAAMSGHEDILSSNTISFAVVLLMPKKY